MRIVCASLPGPGHGHPMLSVARELATRGHEVTFLSGAAHAVDAAVAGAAFRLLPQVKGSPLHELRPYDDAAAQAEMLSPMLDDLRPDAAVVDVITVGGALAMEAHAISFATLVVHPLHTPSRSLPPFGYGRAAGRWPPMRLRDAWMRAENRKDLQRARADLNRGRARLGLGASVTMHGGLSERLALVATLPSLEIQRPDWPAHAHVVGPCLWDAPGEPADPPAGSGSLVMIAPSTAYDGERMLAPALVAVARLGVRAVVTAGAAALPAPLPNGVVATGARHADVLPHVDAVITNGGHGTVLRALTAGRPLVVVPGHGDQQENAFRVERAGAGIQVRRRRPTGRAIARALRRVLENPGYGLAAARIANEAAGLDGPGRAAELVEATFGAGKNGGRAGARPPPERSSQ